MGKIAGFYVMPHPPIIIPEVGKGEEKKIQATYDACKQVADEIGKGKPDTIILITPHGPLFRDAVAISNGDHINGDLGRFGAPEVSLSLEINNELVGNIIKKAAAENIFMASITEDSADTYGTPYTLDHGALVPLYFINKKLSDYKIVHITYGMLAKLQLYKLGMVIQEVIEKSSHSAVLIASGDLSHKLADTGPYSYSLYGEKFDHEILSLLEKGDVPAIFNMDPKMIEEAGECGLKSFYMMLGAMNGYAIQGDLLSYAGTFGVGYGVMKFALEKNNQNMYETLINEEKRRQREVLDKQSPYAKLARESLTHYLTYGDYMEVPKGLPTEMTGIKRGVFVTLKKEGNLRGCVGTIFPRMESVAQEIIRNAVAAGLHDTRFDPVAENELEGLEFSVDVLTKPEVTSKSELDPKRYGVIVTSGLKTGLLLPDLEGVDTAQDQLSIALEKGGISPNESYTIQKFEVVRYL